MTLDALHTGSQCGGVRSVENPWRPWVALVATGRWAPIGHRLSKQMLDPRREWHWFTDVENHHQGRRLDHAV